MHKKSDQALCDRICDAFPRAFRGRLLTDDECVDLGARLIALDESGFCSVLPQVLVNILKHRENSDCKNYVESVVRFLDVQASSEYLSRIASMPDLNRLSKRDSELSMEKEKMVASFSKEQCAVIAEWLVFIEDWPCLKWCVEELQSAVIFWQGRSKQK